MQMRAIHKFLCLVLIFLALFLNAAEEAEEHDPLPQWSEEDAARVMRGECLISDALFRLQEEEAVPPPPPDVLELPAPGPESLNVVSPTEILDEDLAKYFGQKPKSYLVDPQKLMSRQEFRDRLSFLKYHASDSNLDFYVYVFDEQQTIPANIQMDSLFAQQFDGGRPAVIVFYYMGAPERSELYLTPELMRSVGEGERMRALQSSINQAVVKSQPVDQLDGFCVQMSIRIYWMEKAFISGVIAPVMVLEKDEINEQELAARAATTWFKEWQLPICLILGVIIVGIITGWIRRAREKFYFTEYEIAPRMSGSHAAGVGAVITYASAKIPPAMQREQVPDYLRRM
jgi:hypothetical protein